MGDEWQRLTPPSATDNDLALASFGEDGVLLRAGYEDAGELRGATDALPILLTLDELDALAVYAPKVQALVEAAENVRDVHSYVPSETFNPEPVPCDCAECIALRAALALFEEASGG